MELIYSKKQSTTACDLQYVMLNWIFNSYFRAYKKLRKDGKKKVC